MVMKYLSMLLLSAILLTSCDAPNCSCEFDENGEPPKLKVTNNACGIIEEVSLVGYDFKNLAIGEGESKTFTLTDGIPAGLDDVNVNVGVKSSTRGFNGNISVDFTAGQTSGIKLVKVKFPNECNTQYFGLELDE